MQGKRKSCAGKKAPRNRRFKIAINNFLTNTISKKQLTTIVSGRNKLARPFVRRKIVGKSATSEFVLTIVQRTHCIVWLLHTRLFLTAF